MGLLEIHLRGARYLGDSIETDFPNSYVKVKVGKFIKGKTIYKTRTVKNALHPEWNELFKFQTEGYDITYFMFEVWNDRRNVEKDDVLLGEVRLPSRIFEHGVVYDKQTYIPGANLSLAELQLRILAVDFGPSPKNRRAKRYPSIEAFEAAINAGAVTNTSTPNYAAPQQQSYAQPQVMAQQLVYQQLQPVYQQPQLAYQQPQPFYQQPQPLLQQQPQPIYQQLQLVYQQPQLAFQQPQPFYQQPQPLLQQQPQPVNQQLQLVYQQPQPMYGQPAYPPPPQPVSLQAMCTNNHYLPSSPMEDTHPNHDPTSEALPSLCIQQQTFMLE